MDYRSSSSSSTTVLRRGQPFFMAVRMKDRNFDPRRDILRASFSFGICRNLKESKRLLFIYLFGFCQARILRLPREPKLFCLSA
jgi:transglutaminase 1